MVLIPTIVIVCRGNCLLLAIVEGDTVFEDGLELLVEDVLAVGVEGTGELWR